MSCSSHCNSPKSVGIKEKLTLCIFPNCIKVIIKWMILLNIFRKGDITISILKWNVYNTSEITLFSNIYIWCQTFLVYKQCVGEL